MDKNRHLKLGEKKLDKSKKAIILIMSGNLPQNLKCDKCVE